jgi:hypothetical protein
MEMSFFEKSPTFRSLAPMEAMRALGVLWCEKRPGEKHQRKGGNDNEQAQPFLHANHLPLICKPGGGKNIPPFGLSSDFVADLFGRVFYY